MESCAQDKKAASSGKNNTPSRLTDDDVVTHILRYAGRNQYRFLGSISQQFHRIYTATTTFPATNDTSSPDTTSTTATTTMNHPSTNDANTPTKQTYCNITTVDHLTLCYNEIFHNYTEPIKTDDDWDYEDSDEEELRKEKEGRKVYSNFYKSIGRRATIEQLRYIFDKLQCPYNKDVCQAAAGAGRLSVIQFLFDSRLHQMATTIKGDREDTRICRAAASFGHLDIVQYLHAHKCPCDGTSCEYAMRNGHVYTVQYLFDRDYELSYGIANTTWEAVVKNGHLPVIIYLYHYRCPMDVFKLCDFAALYGRQEIFLFLLPKITHILVIEDWESIALNAARGGSLGIVQYVLEKREGDANMCAAAAEYGQLHILQYLRSKNVEWDLSTCVMAAKNGHLHCLQYAHENDCPWDASTCATAAENGHLPALEYAHNNGCPWDISTCSAATRRGHLRELQYAHKNGCPWDESVCMEAVTSRNLQILQYLHENGCPWNVSICNEAVKNWNVNMLQYLHENDCPWDASTCYQAAMQFSFCNLYILKYLHENGCPWDERTVDAAIEHNDLEMLQYARNNGCPWNEGSVCTLAAKLGCLRVLQYLHEMGCPWDESTTEAAATNGNLEALQYAFNNGCPMNHVPETRYPHIHDWIGSIKRKRDIRKKK